MLKVLMCFVKLIAELGKHFIWGKKKKKNPKLSKKSISCRITDLTDLP